MILVKFINRSVCKFFYHKIDKFFNIFYRCYYVPGTYLVIFIFILFPKKKKKKKKEKVGYMIRDFKDKI